MRRLMRIGIVWDACLSGRGSSQLRVRRGSRGGCSGGVPVRSRLKQLGRWWGCGPVAGFQVDRLPRVIALLGKELGLGGGVCRGEAERSVDEREAAPHGGSPRVG